MNKRAKFGLLFSTTLALAIGACAPELPQLRKEVANRIAAPAWMIDREIPAGPFALKAYERMHQRYAPANIYIEGDGATALLETNATTPSNATPKNPVGLHLASRDKSKNVVYLARPCQYTGLLDRETKCDQRYWTSDRFSPEVIAAYNDALNEIKRRYNIEGFNLIGFDGGGAIAALLAAERDDVLSLRTVAGNLDHLTYSNIHGTPHLDGSLNPPDYAGKLAYVPQCHYIGGQDTVIPPAILHSYLQSLGETSCVKYQFVQDAGHDQGWVNKWPELLQECNVECRGPAVTYETIEIQEPYHSPRMTPSKP